MNDFIEPPIAPLPIAATVAVQTLDKTWPKEQLSLQRCVAVQGFFGACEREVIRWLGSHLPHFSAQTEPGTMVRDRQDRLSPIAWLTHEAHMKKNITPGWKFAAIVVEGERVVLHGQNVWNAEWLASSEPPITVKHPEYPRQRHQADVYDLASDPPVRFAAGEFSNGVWGFFLPKGNCGGSERTGARWWRLRRRT